MHYMSLYKIIILSRMPWKNKAEHLAYSGVKGKSITFELSEKKGIFPPKKNETIENFELYEL